MARFRFDNVRDLDRLRELAPAWRQVNRRMATARHFHVPEWFLALVQALDQYNDDNYLFVTIYDPQELVGIVPLRAVDIDLHGVPLKALRLLSNIRETQTTRDMILAGGIDGGAVLVELIDYLDRLDPSWDVVAFAGALADSCAAVSTQKATALSVISTPGGASGRAEFISCGPSDEPLKRLSKNFRQNLRTAHNKLAAKEIRFACAQGNEELLAFYSQLCAIEAAGWKQEDPSTIKNNHMFDTFLRNLMHHLGSSGGFNIYLMELDARAISAMLCIAVNQICFIHVIGYDETYSVISPGNLLMEHLIESRGADGNLRSITTYYAPPWFSRWKPDKTLEVSNIYLFRPSERGRDLHNRLSAASRGESG
jgi:hypothetical protein